MGLSTGCSPVTSGSTYPKSEVWAAARASSDHERQPTSPNLFHGGEQVGEYGGADRTIHGDRLVRILAG